MDINSIINPHEIHKWKVSKNRASLMKLVWIPMLEFDTDITYVYLDLKMARETIKLVKRLRDKNINFLFKSPILSNPKNNYLSENEIHKINISNYFRNFTTKEYNTGFKKIGFDLISNLIDYANKFSCMDILKESYDEIASEINNKYFDWYQKKDIYDKGEDIREEFKGLYRHIQLLQIFK